jgi:hypothetical protein
MMRCPKCLTEVFCPCNHCLERHEDNPKWKWVEDSIQCPNCEFVGLENFAGPDGAESIAAWRKKYMVDPR